jgi:hypothetical protein
MPKRLTLCNLLGSFGYLSCLLQWLWATTLWMPAIMNSQVQELLVPSESNYQLLAAPFDTPSPLAITVAVIVTIVAVAVTIIVLLRLPMTIAKTGQKVTKKSADLLLPTVTSHRPITQKQKRLLTVRLIKAIKLALVLLPLTATLLIYTQTLPLEYDLVILIGSLLAIGSLAWFTMQYTLAHRLSVPADKLT